MSERFNFSKSFEAAEIRIQLKNLVSHTEIDSKGKKIGDKTVAFNPQNAAIELIEVLTNGFALSIPSSICNVGHSLEITFSVKNLSKNPFEFTVLAKAKALEKTSSTQDRVEVELKNEYDPDWLHFCKLYAQKQETILDFIKNARGF